jgi:outer membrane protein TolC
MSGHSRWVVPALAVLLGAPSAARAQEAPPAGEPPSAASPAPATLAAAPLDALVAEALANNPDLHAAAEQVSAARQRPEQARALADPMVSVQYTNDGWAPTLGEMPMTTLAVMGSQALPWPGKRALRAAVAEQDALQAKERLERARLTVAASVKRACWSLALVRETLALLAEQAQTWREAEAVARARYSVGQGAQQDVLRAQVEITRYEQRKAEREAEIDVRTAELNRLLGRPADAPAPATPPLALRPRALEPAALEAEAEAKSPELRGLAAGGERERLAVALAAREFKPDLTVQAGYMNRGGLDPMWQAGVGVNLPVFRGRRRAAAAEAEARGRAVARELESVRAQLRYRTRERVAQLRAAETLARLYADGVVPQARLAYEASIASYQAGRVPFLSVLEALSGLYADRAAHLGVLAAHERIQVALEEASLEATSELPAAGGPGGGMVALSGGSMAAATASASAGSAAPAAGGMGPMGQ